METIRHDPYLRPAQPNGPEFDLYTIPRHSSWFRWDDIHETERAALKEFFDGSSITRTPKIYKDYRDFIINKYREDPSRRLTFTEIRKSLVGDVSLLHKVFRFLDKWGLINFGAARDDLEVKVAAEDDDKVRVEDGAPNGVRVVESPKSLRPISVPLKAAESGEVVESRSKLLPLASYSDVYGELEKPKRFVCGNCGESCDSSRYECKKGNYIICVKCFENGSYGDNKSKDDFELSDSVDNGGKQSVWTDEETLLLLESVLRHGDDWDLVVQSVQTKTKVECISKLIELPLGDVILSSTHGRGTSNGTSVSTNGSKQAPLSSSEQKETIQNEAPLHELETVQSEVPLHDKETVQNEVSLHEKETVQNEVTLLEQETVQSEVSLHEKKNKDEMNGEAVEVEPSFKRKRIASLTDAGSTLMKQVALISTMVDSDITAAAAEAAVGALCDETLFPREIFDDFEDFLVNGLPSSTVDSDSHRSHENEDIEMKERPTESEAGDMHLVQNDIPLTLRLRAAIATAFGAAAAHAKLLVDQEDREIENLGATIIETQLKKLQRKIKHFDELELIMEKEHAELEELKESVTNERIDVLQKGINAGISKWRDRDSVNPQMGSI